MALFPGQDTFVRGEVSPRLHARASLELYRAGLSLCQNFITLPHGGIRKRGGTYFVRETKDSSRVCRLEPFEYDADQAYCLEIGHLYIRIHAYGATVVDGGGAPIEVVTPYTEANLADLKFTQSFDVMWITHPNWQTRTLTRESALVWTLANHPFRDGPFQPVNTEDTLTMYAAAATGNTTVHSSADFFTVSHVSHLIRIDMESYADIAPWEPRQILIGDAGGGNPNGLLRRYDGNVYECVTNVLYDDVVLTGSTPPTHTEGVEKDGPVEHDESYSADGAYVGVEWEFLHPGYGIAVITDLNGPTSVDVTVLGEFTFPDEVVGSGNASKNWRLGAFGQSGWAEAVTLFEERLALSQGVHTYASKTGDFESFALGEKADDGLEFVQSGGRGAGRIRHLWDADGFLALGTVGGLQALSGSGIDEALTPSSFKNRRGKVYGFSRLAPVETEGAYVYVPKGRKALYEITLNSQSRFVTNDLGQISEHIPKKGIRRLDYQQFPDPILWFPLDDGQLGSFTYQPAQEVRGMHRQQLGGSIPSSAWGAAEEVCVTPGQNGIDDVWLSVRRTIGGVTKRYIEIMKPPFEYGTVADAFQVDCGLSYSGAAVGTFSGLTHLNGETVSALAGSKVYTGLVVSGGSVTLPGGATATTAVIGLPFTSTAWSLELDVGAKDGSLIGRRKKLDAVILSLFETDVAGLKIQSMLGGNWEQAEVPTNVASDGTVTLFTGNIKVPVEDSWEGKAQFRLQHDRPTPCTVRAVTPVFDNEP